MRALVCKALEGPDGLEVGDAADPLAEGKVLIEVHAAGVSYPDLLLARGAYQLRLDPPFVPGVEAAGVVRSAPDDAPVSEGDRVMAFSTAGALAELLAVDPWAAFPVPEGLSTESAAGFVMNYQTAHFALHRRGNLRADETVLVHGAAGGVGTAAIQVARGVGARVVAVASTQRKRDVALDAGADDAIDVEGFLETVRGLTGGRGVDVVLDPVGGDRFTDSIRALAPEGRLLVVGFTGGGIPEVRVNRLLLNNVSLVGVAWGAFMSEEPQLGRDINDDLARLVADGSVDPVVSEVLPLDRAADAFRTLERRDAVGKLVIRIRGS
jgi:NADPH2:quinone reductase